ncbi:hypothetical protein [Stenotrophomonas sp. S41]|uniref:hypothetical protein n=1 Tax=Stenotrophomonas sp. S41 TaxID=2767464 RepID=UPI00190CF8C3|nr:hypothetical protein [Stenotrophomonas sp. S41]MBK0013741.1 hypothetical protein [Stenotrophomonas sp. S41]
MKADHRTVLLWLLASLGACVLLFVLLFDRYSYYDYQKGKCEAAGPVELVVSLVGSFDSGRPRERSSPYYLRVEIVGENKGRVDLSEARLTSSKSRESVDLGDIRKTEVARQGDPVPVIVYSVDSLRLDYDDYVFEGAVATDPVGRSSSVAFTCSLTKSYRSEWRIPFWDALMSV